MKKIIFILFTFFILNNFTFAEEYKICDKKVDFLYSYDWPTENKKLVKLEKKVVNFSKNIFSQKKLNCEDIKNNLKLTHWTEARNKKDIIFWISFLSKQTNKQENYYFINDKKLFSIDYNGYNIWNISRYWKHSLAYFNNIKSDVIDENDYFCKNNAWYYIDWKRVVCLEKLSYYPNKFLKDYRLEKFFSKKFYWQEKYKNFQLSEKIIKKIENLVKNKKIQDKKEEIYKKIEKLNKNYETKKLENISKKDYITYEIWNYIYWYMKLLDLLNK